MADDVSPSLEKTAEFTEELMQAVTSASYTFTNEFVNSLLDGQNALESFKNFSRNIVSQIISIFIQLEVVNRILAQIFPNFEGTVGTGLFSSGGGDVSSSSSGWIYRWYGRGRNNAKRASYYCRGKRCRNIYTQYWWNYVKQYE